MYRNEKFDPRSRHHFDSLSLTSLVGIVAAEDGDPVVQEEENEDEEECDANRRAADPVDGVGLAGGEDGGDERPSIGGEELNGEEEDDG